MSSPQIATNVKAFHRIAQKTSFTDANTSNARDARDGGDAAWLWEKVTRIRHNAVFCTLLLLLWLEDSGYGY